MRGLWLRIDGGWKGLDGSVLTLEQAAVINKEEERIEAERIRRKLGYNLPMKNKIWLSGCCWHVKEEER